MKCDDCDSWMKAPEDEEVEGLKCSGMMTDGQKCRTTIWPKGSKRSAPDDDEIDLYTEKRRFTRYAWSFCGGIKACQACGRWCRLDSLLAPPPPPPPTVVSIYCRHCWLRFAVAQRGVGVLAPSLPACLLQLWMGGNLPWLPRRRAEAHMLQDSKPEEVNHTCQTRPAECDSISGCQDQ